MSDSLLLVVDEIKEKRRAKKSNLKKSTVDKKGGGGDAIATAATAAVDDAASDGIATSRKSSKSELLSNETNSNDAGKKIAVDGDVSISNANNDGIVNSENVELDGKIIENNVENTTKITSSETSDNIVVNDASKPLPKKILFDEPYEVVEEVKTYRNEKYKDIDENKLMELEEAFKMFDFDSDGYIDASDLRSMYISLGDEDVADQQIHQMLSEALNPLDFDAFVNLMGYRTVDLDPEDVLVSALSKWDKQGNGLISEEVIKHDLTTFGDKFTEKEANIALEEAPIAKGTGDGFKCKGPVMIDYPAYCKSLCSLSMRVKQ